MPLQAPSPLQAATLASLRAFFDRQHHNPSAEHWAALGDVVGVMDGMAAGTAAARVFVGALDPGVGKSSAVLEFAKALMASEAHVEVGMLVCVGRIEEAATFARALASPAASFAVLTSDAAANALGTAEPGEAQVLITTQQRVELVTQHATFATAEAFHYRGAVRAVRVWDEAWMPGGAVTITGEDMLAMLKPIRQRSPECRTAVQAFAISLGDLESGERVQVPDFEGEHGMAFLDVLQDIEATGKARDDERATLRALSAINGKVARVRTEGSFGTTVLTYEDRLPEDLPPLLVLDASARVRTAYRLIEEYRGGVTRLREAAKDYTPLRVHYWDRSGSKSGWATGSKDLVAGIVETILERPGEKWLVVVHKPVRDAARRGATVDPAKAITAKLPKGVRPLVSFITWGSHMATNAFVDVPNVILAGTLFMRPSHYIATTHMAQGSDVAHGFAQPGDVRAVETGEHANFILQALCRGRVRKSDGAKCQPMNAYVIASKRHGIEQALPAIFPGCVVVPWREPKPSKMPGKLREALAFVDATLKQGATDIPFAWIRDRLNVPRANFSKLITSRDEWVTEMHRRNLVAYGGGGRPGGVRVVDVRGTAIQAL